MSKINDYKSAKKEHEGLIDWFNNATVEGFSNNNTICLKYYKGAGPIWCPCTGNSIIQRLITKEISQEFINKVIGISAAEVEQLRKEAQEEAIAFIKEN